MTRRAASPDIPGRDGRPDASTVGPDLGRTLLVASLAAFAVVTASSLAPPKTTTLVDFFLASDRLWLVVGALALLLARVVSGARLPARAAQHALRHPWLTVCLIAMGVVLASAATAGLAIGGYGLSRDEVMADFDAAIFRGGHLVAPVAPEWRSFVPALSPESRLAVADNAGWASLYLPVNSVLRALFGFLADPSLLNPILAGIAVLAAAGVARQLWPARAEAPIVAAVLLGTSAQLVVAAGTPYAMTGHLAFNLVWLWLFLRGGRPAHAAALVVGFLATGLHQVIFHPLFVAPFVLQLWISRRWTLAATYSISYALFGLFWLYGWQATPQLEGLAAASATGLDSASLTERLAALLRTFRWSGLDPMAKNLVRFVAWQNPLTIPLAVLALISVRRMDGTLRCLALGLVLTVAAMVVLMPQQGHGWGYRYLHGLLGSVCLLGVAGWLTTAERARATHGLAPWGALALASLAAVLVMLPGRGLEAKAFTAPYMQAWQAMSRVSADVVLVDREAVPYAPDLVRNDPYLRNRPKIMLLQALNHAQIADLCRRYTVAIFDLHQAQRFGFPSAITADADSHRQSPFDGTACSPRPPPALQER